MMSTDRSHVVSPHACCPVCSKPLPEDAPGGLCPECLLDLVNVEDPEDAEIVTNEETDPLTTHQVFGDYELVEELARGGMGVVYKARQISLKRTVALKMILAGRFATKNLVERFKAEAATAALLQHPNIVAVHEVGVHQGQHYFSMDFVEGCNLTHLVGARPPPPTHVARYVRAIADAVQHAHDHGILHRDLKPSNILIDQSDRPRVTDFGLAKRLEAGTSLTVTGQMLGSPNFMPPEQVTADGEASPQGDVYGLGAILYYLLTARAPFQGETVPSVIAQVIGGEVVAPSLLNSIVPPDLETICLKCLEKEPRRRYSTARNVAEDLDHFLRHEPITARPVGLLGRVWRWCRRRPALSSVLILLHLVFALGLAGILWEWRQALAGRLATSQYLYDADMLLAQQAIDEGNFGRATELLEKHRPPARTRFGAEKHADLRGWEWYYFRDRCRSDELATLGAHSNAITAMAYSPKGRFLATADLEGGLQLWDPQARRQLAAWEGHGQEIDAVAFSPDERWLAAGGREERVDVYDLNTLRRALPALVYSSPVFALAFSADNRFLKCCCGHDLSLWGMPEGKLISRIDFDGRNPAVFGLGGEMLAVGVRDGGIRLYQDGSTNATILSGHKGRVKSVSFSSDGRVLYSASLDGTARAWDVASSTEIHCFEGHRINVNAVSESPRRNLIATGSSDETIRLWDTVTGGSSELLPGQNSPVCQLEFSPDGQTLASGGMDGQIKLWPVEPRQAMRESLALPSTARGWSLSPEANTLEVLTEGGVITPLDLRSMDYLPAWNPPRPHGDSCPIQPGCKLRAVDEGHGVVGLWERASGNRIGQMEGAPDPVRAMVFSPDAQTLALADNNGKLQLWSATTLRLIKTLGGHAGRVTGSLQFSPDSTRLLAVYDDGYVALWKPSRPGPPTIRHAHGMLVNSAAFSPDGRIIATGANDGLVKLWNTDTQHEITRLSVSVLPVLSVAFSPDGRRLAVGAEDGRVTLYDAATFQPIAHFTGHAHPQIRGLAFTPDGTTLVSVSLKDVIVRHANTRR